MAFTLDAMSIYGQDTRMLDSLYNKQNALPEAMASTSLTTPLEHKPPSRCLLLALPLELRQQIYSLALPDTYEHQQKGIVWLRGSTSLLATNTQIHAEASPFLYSRNTFAIDVTYDCATFNYRWSLTRPSFRIRRLAFPEQLGDRYIPLLRNFQVLIHLVDPYTGMSKFNYGGSGLLDGLRDQVKFLCQSLNRIPKIHSLKVRMFDNAYNIEASQRVLEPFLDLNNTQRGTIHANLEPSFRENILAHLNGNKKTTSLTDLPYEIRQQIYRCLLPGANCPSMAERGGLLTSDPPQKLSSLIALTYLNHDFHAEVQTFIFHNLQFRLNIHSNLTYEVTTWDRSPSGFGHHRVLPISGFESSIYKPAISQIRELFIGFCYIPLAIQSPRYQALETFLDTLISLLHSAPLKRLSVEYITDNHRSSGASSSRAHSRTRSQLANSVQSLDMEPLNNALHHRPWDQMGNGEPHSEDATTTASPTSTTFATSATSSILLQTPPVLYLVAKLNPIMAKVKSRPGGTVWVNRRDRATSSKHASYDTLNTTDHTDGIGVTDALYGDSIERSPITDSPQQMHRSASPPRTILGSNHSVGSKRRGRGSQMLFSNVPI